jgi:hypothetical protein
MLNEEIEIVGAKQEEVELCKMRRNHRTLNIKNEVRERERDDFKGFRFVVNTYTHADT